MSAQPVRGWRTGMSPFKAGVIGLLVALTGTYFGFTKDIPFTHEFRMKAVFTDSVMIAKKSPVRIAGVNVGKVLEVKRDDGSRHATVTFELYQKGLPIHRDATAKIRSRIFLEGNFFVDLKPGSPSAPEIEDGDTLPVAQTANPVQLDRVLSSLDSSTRGDLKTLIKEYGAGLNSKPTSAQNRSLPREVQGLSGAQANNRALRYFPKGTKGGAQVANALQGTERHDLSRLIAGLAETSKGFGINQAQLATLFTNFNRGIGAFAANEKNLRDTFRGFSDVAIAAHPTVFKFSKTLTQFDGFLVDLTPGISEVKPTIRAAIPWFDQVTAFFTPEELRGLVHFTRPMFRDLAATSAEALKTFPELGDLASCFEKTILPTTDTPIIDPPHSTGVESYKEFWYALVGAAGESQNFDANGSYVKISPGGGRYKFNTETSKSRKVKYYGTNNRPLIGTRPAMPAASPPLYDKKQCDTNKPADVNSAIFKAATAGKISTAPGGEGR